MPSPAPEPLSPRPLTIWLVNPLAEIPWEGPQVSRCLSLARVLADRGHEVTWWTGSWSHRHQAARRVPVDLDQEEGFTLRAVAVSPYAREASLARLTSHRGFGRTFERVAAELIAAGQLERPDMIVAALPPLEALEASLRLARRLEATFVADVEEFWPESLTAVLPGLPWIRRLIARFFLAGMRRRRDAVVAAADAVAAASRDLLAAVEPPAAASATNGETDPGGCGSDPLLTVPRQTRHVFYPGPYLEEFAGLRRRVRPPDAGEIPPQPPLACIQQISSRHSGLPGTIIEAARLLEARRIEAVIHVTGEPGCHPSLVRSAQRLQGTCRVQCHGPLDRPALIALLSSCDVGLVCEPPDSPHVLPSAACDYAAAGLAIVTPSATELGELVDLHQAGIRLPGPDPGSLADAIGTLAGDRRTLAALAAAARRLAAAAFDREATAARFADWLEIVGTGGPAESTAVTPMLRSHAVAAAGPGSFASARPVRDLAP